MGKQTTMQLIKTRLLRCHRLLEDIAPGPEKPLLAYRNTDVVYSHLSLEDDDSRRPRCKDRHAYV